MFSILDTELEILNSSRHNTKNEATIKAHRIPTMTLIEDDIGFEVGAILEKIKVLRLKDSAADDDGGGPTAATAEKDRNSTTTTYSSFLHTFRRSVAITKNPAITRSLVSQELLRLSPQERNAIYEEQHGVTSLGVDESCMQPAWYDELLNHMAHELWLLPPELKSAYEQSAATTAGTNDSYLQDRHFRLRFLRAELFHPPRAALRFANFIQNLFELFGPQTFYRPPRLTDFTKDELRILNLGRIQLLPYRDRAGRRVIVLFPPQGNHEITVVARVCTVTILVCNFIIRQAMHHLFTFSSK